MCDIYAFNSNDIHSELLIENEIEKQLLFLKDIDWFHGTIDRKDAEKRITTNGEFLVRLSREKECKFVVSTKWNGKYLHVIVKNDVDTNKKQLTYYIAPRFKFSTITDMIIYHKTEQYPLSNSSEAVLYRAVIRVDKKEPKFRKSVRAPHKPSSKVMPRCGSETFLGSQRYSTTFAEINKSLKELPTTATNAPMKPNFRIFTSKPLSSSMRPIHIQVRNEKLYKESGDYSDYKQLQDSAGGLQREQARRGMSLDGFSPSLFGFNDETEPVDITRRSTMDSSVYVSPGVAVHNKTQNDKKNGTSTSISQRRGSAAAYIAHTSISDGSPVFISLKSPSDNDYLPFSKDSSHRSVIPYTTQGMTPATSCDTLKIPLLKSSLTLQSFINLKLSEFPLFCCGPVEGVFDIVAINKAAAFLLSHTNHPLALCVHFLDELHRIFQKASSDVAASKVGYRSFFLIGSEQCQKDLSIRQTALTNFVMASIVCTPSNDRRVQLILFWIKCADYLLTHVRDMFHFRSVITAIFSEQVASLKVWKILYRKDSSMKARMEYMREAICDGCFMRTEIHQCVPDIVHLYSVFTSDDDDLDTFCEISVNVAEWSMQSFDDESAWLVKIRKDLQSTVSIPFLRELVQTETLLSLVLGRSTISSLEIDSLMGKVENRISTMTNQRNLSTV